MSDVDFIKWENDDAGVWRLTLDGDGFPLGAVSFTFREWGAALELWMALDSTIGAHHREGEAVRRSMPARDIDEDSGYALDDPKHPSYHERMAGAADHARKAAREG